MTRDLYVVSAISAVWMIVCVAAGWTLMYFTGPEDDEGDSLNEPPL